MYSNSAGLTMFGAGDANLSIACALKMKMLPDPYLKVEILNFIFVRVLLFVIFHSYSNAINCTFFVGQYVPS